MSHSEMNSTSTLQKNGTAPHADPIPFSGVVSGQVPTSSAGGPSESNQAETDSPALRRLYQPIARELSEVEASLGRELQSPHEALVQVLRHGTQLGGKRMRPALLLLVGRAVGPLSKNHIVLGTVVEMVHTATLIHDDVLDEADTRRHVPTINAQWNDQTSILMGDYLFAQSFRLAATLDSTNACQMVGEAARLVCEGELRQILSRDVLEISEQDYVEMIRGKTAELCRVACELGARFSGGTPATIEAMGHYGDSLGIAFQIADDFLDLWGDDGIVGKTLGTDLGQGKMTLPLIRLRDTVTREDWATISNILTGPADRRLNAIWPFLQRSDARAYTQSVSESYKRQAIRSLNCLPASPAKQALIELASFSVDRRF